MFLTHITYVTHGSGLMRICSSNSILYWVVYFLPHMLHSPAQNYSIVSVVCVYILGLLYWVVYFVQHMLHSPAQNNYSIVFVVCVYILGLAQQRNVASPAIVGEAHQVNECEQIYTVWTQAMGRVGYKKWADLAPAMGRVG